MADLQKIMGIAPAGIQKVDNIAVASIQKVMGLTYPSASDDDAYTMLCSHFDGADAATAYTDPKAGAYTFVGTAQLDDAQKVFGATSLSVDGNSDRVTLPDNDNWDFNADFTVDFRVRFLATGGAAHQFIIGTVDYYNGSGGWGITQSATNKIISFYANYSGGWAIAFSTTGVTININTWYHVAVVRNGTSIKIYIDGTERGSATNNPATNITSANTLTIGRNTATEHYYFGGWVDEVRISKGIARWTSSPFTPPAVAYIV